MQVEVLDFVDLSHSTFCDIANDKEPVSQDIARSRFELRARRMLQISSISSNPLVSSLSGGAGHRFFGETGWRMLKKASGTLILDEEGLDRTP